MHLKKRPRRLRQNEAIRSMLQEHTVSVDDLIMPLFVKSGNSIKEEIPTMPGQFRYSIDELIKKVAHLQKLGIKCIALFPIIEDSLKDSMASEAINEQGLYLTAIREVKKEFPQMLVMSDIALDPYSSDGHDGLVDEKSKKILNDESIDIFKQMAIAHAKAGADILGPSDMMDGRVRAIRDALESNGFKDVVIMSYCVKYASSFYGPFRDALDSAPKNGDKKSYQMDYHNKKDALIEARADEAEGADILMVKPGLSYLDIIQDLSQNSSLPIAAYNVSGEYAMVKFAHQAGAVDEKQIMMESLTSFKRAGAQIILTYFAEEMAMLLSKS